jgi:hypothetical protein
MITFKIPELKKSLNSLNKKSKSVKNFPDQYASNQKKLIEFEYKNRKSVFGKFISSDEKRNLKKIFCPDRSGFHVFKKSTHTFLSNKKSNTFFSAVFFESKLFGRLGFVLIFYDFQIEQIF